MSFKSRWAEIEQERKALYLAGGLIVVILMIWGLIAFPAAVSSERAQDKADELIAQFTEAGLPAPSQEFLVDTLGTDGGQICDDPGGALEKARWDQQLTNGAAHVGARPVIAAERVVQAEKLILTVYCPDKLPDFEEYVGDLEYADVVGE